MSMGIIIVEDLPLIRNVEVIFFAGSFDEPVAMNSIIVIYPLIVISIRELQGYDR